MSCSHHAFSPTSAALINLSAAFAHAAFNGAGGTFLLELPAP